MVSEAVSQIACACSLLDVLTQAVAHEVKGTIRRDEADRAVILKPRQAHTLVELHVLQVHGLLSAAATLGLKQHLKEQSINQSGKQASKMPDQLCHWPSYYIL